MDAQYRKHNDRTQNSSTYHKKDGTNTRAILKEETRREVDQVDGGEVDSLYDQMLELTDGQRLDLISQFCKDCGSADSGCSCMREEPW